MDKLISILVASYNHEKYIGYMLESALNQTYSNIELIIIDDCSKDKTNEIIESYKEKCEEKFTRFIHIKKEENKGIIDSVNKLIDQAQGEYCFLMASDDAIKPNAIKILANYNSSEFKTLPTLQIFLILLSISRLTLLLSLFRLLFQTEFHPGVLDFHPSRFHTSHHQLKIPFH